ncbi:MAG: Peptide methionine sulfoxide reductase msrA [Flavipsychrobacter sp.]|nr:Peptide methionine sulfoxide reductase msrA [Flavipsychrobacter sp.]
MHRLSSYLSVALLALLLSSCGQAVTPQQSKNIALNYAKDSIPADLRKYSQATFAAGCFWHEETLFESIKGVVHGISGYAGGTTQNPTYESIETGTTGHAETVNIYYDSSKISYYKLLQVYFESQEDPTQVNGQGPDNGTQYRSIIFYRNAQEMAMAKQYIDRLNKSGKYSKPIAAEVVPYTTFWRAEDYHQHYIDHNTENPYVQNVSIRDIARFQATHPEMIKPGHSFAAAK